MYKAVTSFSGVISMRKGEVREISDLFLVKDLLNAGYIEEIKEVKEVEKAKEVKPRKRKLRKENKDESDHKGQ